MSILLATVVVSVLTFGGCYAPPPTFGELPDFSLTAVSAGQAPRSFSRADLLGRVWIADFIFTHCTGPCPAISTRMAGFQKTLPASVGLLTLTVDPDRDDAKALEAYARRFGADPKRWLFVTGPKGPLIDLLVRGFKLPAVEDSAAPSGRRVTHSTRLVLLDAKGRLRGYYDSDDDAQVASLSRVAAHL